MSSTTSTVAAACTGVFDDPADDVCCNQPCRPDPASLGGGVDPCVP
jgi:hypothetical protein